MRDKVRNYVDIAIYYVRLKLHRHRKILAKPILHRVHARYVNDFPI